MGKTASLANIGTIADSSLGFRNRIINGAMSVHQRGGTISATGTDNTYGLDRFAIRTTAGSAVVSMQQSTTAATGFYNSLLCTVTTADASLAANDLNVLFQRIEGVNVADLGWGTASAQSVTISFQVRSSVTGTYGVGIQNNASNRSYPSTYTINAADTWETKTITIPGDTTGTWNLGTTSTALYLFFSLGAGSNYTGTANAWAAADYRGTTGQVNWCATLSNTFYITGVQLEKGSTATSFDYRPIGTELALCQRYYQRYGDATTTKFVGSLGVAPSSGEYDICFPLTGAMRSAPTMNYANMQITDGAGNNFTPSSITTYQATTTTAGFYMGATGLTAFRPYFLRTTSSAGYLDASSEL